MSKEAGTIDATSSNRIEQNFKTIQDNIIDITTNIKEQNCAIQESFIRLQNITIHISKKQEGKYFLKELQKRN